MQKPYLPPKPIEPIKTDKKVDVAYEIYNTTDRIPNWEGCGRYDDYDDDDNDDDNDAKTYNKVITKMDICSDRGHVIRLSDVIEHLPPDVKLEDLYFTASFNEDHLQLHVRYNEKADLYSLQMEKYKEDMDNWNENKKYYDINISYYERTLKEELKTLAEERE